MAMQALKGELGKEKSTKEVQSQKPVTKLGGGLCIHSSANRNISSTIGNLLELGEQADKENLDASFSVQSSYILFYEATSRPSIHWQPAFQASQEGHLQHIAQVLVLLEPLQRGMAQPLVRLCRDHKGLKVPVIKAGVAGAGVELALLLAPLYALVHHLAHAQQRYLQYQQHK